MRTGVERRRQPSRHASESVEHEAAGDRDVETGASSDHWDLNAQIGGFYVLVGDAVPFMAEQDDRPLAGWLEARKRGRAISQFDGKDAPARSALLLGPPVLAGMDPVDARSSARAERVALLKGGAVVLRVGNRDTCADRIAGSEEGPEVRLVGDP
jgi:hypothetical protein